MFSSPCCRPRWPAITIHAPHAAINDRPNFRRIDGEPIPTRARLRLHERILADWRASRTQVRRDRGSMLLSVCRSGQVILLDVARPTPAQGA